MVCKNWNENTKYEKLNLVRYGNGGHEFDVLRMDHVLSVGQFSPPEVETVISNLVE